MVPSNIYYYGLNKMKISMIRENRNTVNSNCYYSAVKRILWKLLLKYNY